MRNRIPTQILDNGAIRYAVYDENGTLLRYEYMLPADEPTDPGTPLNKGTLLSDDVEALIWGAAADRTPNDAFGKVSELYQHWWSVLHGEAYSYYEDVKTPIDARYQIHMHGTTPPTTYSKEISIDESGNITLVNPEEIYGSLNSASAVTSFMQKLTEAAPCYVLTEGGIGLGEEMLFYIPAGATYSSGNTNASEPYTIVGEYYEGSHYIYLNRTAPNGLVASIVTTQLVTVPAGETTYAHSPDRNAYPDSGTVDGLTYKYLGVPFENAKTAKGFKKIGEGKIAVNGSSCYLELEQNLDNYAIVIFEGNNLRGNKDSGTAAIVTVLSVESLTATRGDTVGELLTAYSSNSATNKVSVAISGISNRACIYLYRDYIDTSYFQASKYLYFKSDYALLDEATFTVWGFEK